MPMVDIPFLLATIIVYGLYSFEEELYTVAKIQNGFWNCVPLPTLGNE